MLSGPNVEEAWKRSIPFGEQRSVSRIDDNRPANRKVAVQGVHARAGHTGLPLVEAVQILGPTSRNGLESVAHSGTHEDNAPPATTPTNLLICSP